MYIICEYTGSLLRLYELPQSVVRIYELLPLARQDTLSGATWTERRVLVCSLPYATAQAERLREKIRSAQKALLERFLPN